MNQRNLIMTITYIIAFLVVILLPACNGTLTTTPVETRMPVGTPCLTPDQVPAKPEFVTDAQLAIKSDDSLIFSLAADRLARQGYIVILEAKLSGCIGVKPIPDGVVLPKQDEPPARPWWQFF